MHLASTFTGRTLTVLRPPLQVLVVLGFNITGDDCTVLARANGQYINAQVPATSAHAVFTTLRLPRLQSACMHRIWHSICSMAWPVQSPQRELEWDFDVPSRPAKDRGP